MSRIARQLCDEIESPLRGKDNQRYRNVGKYDEKPKRSIVIEKQKVISKVVPNDRSASRIKIKSEETVFNKSFINTAVNTTLRGPFATDRNCVTLLHNRTNEKCICKPTQKCYSFRRNAKEVQTFDPKLYSFSDKACLQSIETMSCGTQFFNFASKPQDQLSTASHEVTQRDSRLVEKSQRDYMAHTHIIQRDSLRQANVNKSALKQLELRKLGTRQTYMGQREGNQSEPATNSNKVPPVNYMGARRWSLSKHPTKWPDY